MDKVFLVKKEHKDKRLDMFLKDKLGLSRNKIKQIIDKGEIFINGKQVVIAGWDLNEGDKVSISKSPVIKRGYLKILFEDNDIIVVDKPAGLLSVPVKGSDRNNMMSDIIAYLKRKYGEKGSFIYPVHRLDSETSGVMVFAKSKRGAYLERLFKFHKIERKYLALVSGKISKGQGSISLPLAKGKYKQGRKSKVDFSSKAKEAITRFEVKERYANCSLVELEVLTGRTHQIRVHLSSIGYPLIGDKVYNQNHNIKFRRQALHASQLVFKHPVTKKLVKFKSTLPKDIKQLIDQLRTSC